MRGLNFRARNWGVTGFISAEGADKPEVISSNLGSSIHHVTVEQPLNLYRPSFVISKLELYLVTHRTVLGSNNRKESQLQATSKGPTSRGQVPTSGPASLYLAPPKQWALNKIYTGRICPEKEKNFVKYPSPLHTVKISLRLMAPLKLWLNDSHWL